MTRQTNPSQSISIFNVPEGDASSLKLKFVYRFYVQDEMVASSASSSALDENGVSRTSELLQYENELYRTFRYVEIELPPPTSLDNLAVQYQLIDGRLDVSTRDLLTREGDTSIAGPEVFWNHFSLARSQGKTISSLINFEEDFSVGLVDFSLGDGSISDDLESLSAMLRAVETGFVETGGGYSSEELIDQIVNPIRGQEADVSSPFLRKEASIVSKRVEASRITTTAITRTKPGEGVSITAGPDFSISITEDLVRSLLLGSMTDPNNPGSLDLAQSLSSLDTSTRTAIEKVTTNPNFPEVPIKRGTVFQTLSSYDKELKLLTEPVNKNEPWSPSKFEIVPLGYLVKRIDLGILGTGSDSKKSTYFEPATNFQQIKKLIDEAVIYGHSYRYVVRKLYGVRAYLKVSSSSSSLVKTHFILASRPLKLKNSQISTIYTESPLPPTDLRFKYDYSNSSLGVEWNQRPRRDSPPVVEYLIFKRSGRTLNEALRRGYRLVDRVVTSRINGQYSNLITGPFDPGTIQSGALVGRIRFWFDASYDKSLVNMYSIVSLDPHGHISNLSQQMIVRFNSTTRKIVVDLASPSGAPLQYPNFFLAKRAGGFSRTHITGDFSNSLISSIATTSGKTKARLYFNPDCQSVIVVEPGRGAIQRSLFLSVPTVSSVDQNVYYLNAINLSDEETDTIRIRLRR